jgi:signal peptidase I
MTEASPPEKSIYREYYEALLIAVVFVNFARIFLFQAFKIPTGSMYDNLLIGDHIIVNKFTYGPQGGDSLEKLFAFREIERGDIVVFRFPKDRTIDFVKRVIGLPGDEVMIRDKVVYVNGVPLDEKYVVHDDPTVYQLHTRVPEPYRSRDQYGPLIVPKGHYFVMGDNRDRSNDSRYWGPVPRSLIKGRAFLIYWSFDAVPPPAGSPTSERIKELFRVVLHFFPLTRWDRTFLVVDSKYHYHRQSEDAGSRE